MERHFSNIFGAGLGAALQNFTKSSNLSSDLCQEWEREQEWDIEQHSVAPAGPRSLSGAPSLMEQEQGLERINVYKNWSAERKREGGSDH